MRTNLSSQICLNRVSPKYYKPENAIERSVLTRFEKVPTDIYESVEEGVCHIANEIASKIQDRLTKSSAVPTSMISETRRRRLSQRLLFW